MTSAVCFGGAEVDAECRLLGQTASASAARVQFCPNCVTEAFDRFALCADPAGNHRPKHSDAMEQFDQLLTCAICLDRYRNPKLLPCQHSFCMEPCMEGLVNYVTRQVSNQKCSTADSFDATFHGRSNVRNVAPSIASLTRASSNIRPTSRCKGFWNFTSKSRANYRTRPADR